MAHQYRVSSLAETVAGGRIELTGAEAKHAATVSRIRAGESIRVSDGAGRVATVTVLESGPNLVVGRIDALHAVPAPTPSVWLVQALAKGDRDELGVQAATELGIDHIVPWAAARSVSRWDAAKAVKGRARWQSIVDEAAKQSLRAWVPEVGELVQTADLVRLAGRDGHRLLVCAPSGERSLADLPLDDRTAVLVVGPEGGMDDAELASLRNAGAEIVHLGSEVLRTSTAGPAALAVLASRLGRWSRDTIEP